MSLINRMLEDLDARNSQGAQSSRGKLSRRGVSARLPWIIAAISLLLAGALATAWLMRDSLESARQDEPEATDAVVAQAKGSANDSNSARAKEQANGPAIDAASNVPREEAATSSAPEIPANESRTDVAESTAVSESDNLPPLESSSSQEESLSEQTVTETTKPTDKLAVDEPVRKDAAAVSHSVADATPDSGSDDEPGEGDGELQVSRHLPAPEDVARNQINEGLRAMRAGQFELAATRLESGLDILPAEDQAREALYVAYRRQGRIAEAEGILRDGLALADEPSHFAKLLARELAARDARSEALRILALEIPPVTRDPEYHALHGSLLQQEARYAEALPVYEGLVKYYPDNGTWLAGLGMAQEQTGNINEARSSYRRALRAGGLAATVNEYVQSRLAALDAAAESGE